MSHPEKIPSAIERYQKEILRVLGVLESVLSKREWLVGGKCTVADLSFIPCVAPLFTYSAHCVLTCCGARHMWNALVLDGTIANGYSPAQFEADFPAVYKWHHVMTNRPTVKKIYAIRETFKV
ncbi:Glutathione S-transferase 1 [Trametes pubescens]|uniref:Glutathione S-transferase 1 n=1 Tax=Trametes pubescens TaxID=154538 RepID=A0A1M2W284_TRAPU|nr:Glutathione S-transferase 1 [Trametes pubescens]